MTDYKKSRRRYWVKAEMDILADFGNETHRKLQLRLRAKGFERSLESIECKRMRMGWSARIDRDAEDAGYTVKELCELLGVHANSPRRWIAQGMLKGHHDAPENPTSWLRVMRKDLRVFMIRYPMHWDSKKCDHLWLVSILGENVE